MGTVDMEEISKVMFDALQYYAHSGDPSYLLLPQRALLAVPNALGDSSLHVAIIGGQKQAANTIAKLMAKEHLDSYNKEMKSPLHLAIGMGQIGTVHTLLQLGANVGILDAKGNTSAHLACKSVDVEMIASVVANIGDHLLMAQVNHEGLAPIHIAAANKNVQILIAVINCSQGVINTPNMLNGSTALHIAVHHALYEHVAALLARGAQVHERDFQGNTPLHLAAMTGREDIVTLLLQNKADISTLNLYLHTPLDIARAQGSQIFVEALKVDMFGAETDTSMAALEADYELLSVDDVATLPSSHWELSGLNRGSRHARSRLNRMLKGHKKNIRVPFLASKSRKLDPAPVTSAREVEAPAQAPSAPPTAAEEKRAHHERYPARIEMNVQRSATTAAQEKEVMSREYTVTDYVVNDVKVSASGCSQSTKAAEVARAHRLTRHLDTDSLAMID